MQGAPRPPQQQRVRFAPTPEEQQLWALAAVLHAALLLLFWPIILPWRLLLAGERRAARALGVYLGLLQGGAYAASAIAHVLLSRGGVKRLVWGLDAARMMPRAVSVPVPGTPPHADAATADRLPSDTLHAALEAAAAAARAATPATEPAVPQPITPPVVAPAEPPPPPGARATGSCYWHDGGARAAASARAAAPKAAQLARPAMVAAYATALLHTLPGALAGPPSLDAAVEEWQQAVDASVAATAAASEAAAGEEAAGEPEQLNWQELQQKKNALHALQAREERLLAAFEPAGPEAQQSAAAWLQASQPILATSSSTDLSATQQEHAASVAGPAAGPAAPPSPESGGAAGTEQTQLLQPADHATPVITTTNKAGITPGSAAAAAAIPPTSRPPRSASASSLGSAAWATPATPATASSVPPGLPPSARRVGRSASAASFGGGAGTTGGALGPPAGPASGEGPFRASPFSSRPGTAASGGTTDGSAGQVSSHPLPDRDAASSASSNSGSQDEEEGPKAAAAGPLAAALVGQDPGRLGGLEAAAAAAAAGAVHAALHGGVAGGEEQPPRAATTATNTRDQFAASASGELVSPPGSPELAGEDSMEITGHTKHEKR